MCLNYLCKIACVCVGGRRRSPSSSGGGWPAEGLDSLGVGLICMIVSFFVLCFNCFSYGCCDALHNMTLDRLFLLGVLITVLCIMQRNNIPLHSSVLHTSVSSRSGHLFPPFFGSRTTFLALVLVPLPHLTLEVKCSITRTEPGSNTHI